MKQRSFFIGGAEVLFAAPLLLEPDQPAIISFTDKKKQFIIDFSVHEIADDSERSGLVAITLAGSKKYPDKFRISVEIPVDSKKRSNGQSGAPAKFEVGGVEFSLTFRVNGYRNQWLLLPNVTYERKEESDEQDAETE